MDALGVGAGARGSDHYIVQKDALMESDLWQECISYNHRMGNQNDSFAFSFTFLCVDVMALPMMPTKKEKASFPLACLSAYL